MNFQISNFLQTTGSIGINLGWNGHWMVFDINYVFNWIKLSRWSPEPIMDSDCQLFPRSCGPKFKEGCNEKIEKRTRNRM